MGFGWINKKYFKKICSSSCIKATKEHIIILRKGIKKLGGKGNG
jgi:hypothetical protein